MLYMLYKITGGHTYRLWGYGVTELWGLWHNATITGRKIPHAFGEAPGMPGAT
jgi:hypothetical protein